MTSSANSEPCRLLVVSDIHAFSKSANSADSVLDLTDASPTPANPLTDLIKLAQSSAVKADALICAGDICNRADAGGLAKAWGHLHELKSRLGASCMIATCGNHDLDSRYLQKEADPDPKGALLALDPRFPFDEENLANKFWARDYAVVSISPSILLVNLNTSAYHGGPPEEINYGRVSKRTIAAISAEIETLPAAKIYILLCHHHPVPLGGWGNSDDTEFLKNGQELLDALGKATRTSWLVIHGHRHTPRLLQGASSMNSAPFVLGAGSLGARMVGVPNQCHLIELNACDISDHASIIGKVQTWSWTDSSRWKATTYPGGLPANCGFGYRGQIATLAKQIIDYVNNSFAYWRDIRAALPAVDLLMPDDFSQLEALLRSQSVNCLRSSDGSIVQVGI